DHAEGVEVGARVASLALDLLRRHVVRRPDALREAGPGELAQRRVERDAEVEELHPAVQGEHDVLRLEVTVHDAVIVEIAQRIADPDADPAGILDREVTLALQVSAEELAGYVLQDHVHTALLLRLERADDRGMMHPQTDLFLAPEAIVEDDVALVLEVRYLQDDSAAGLEVAGVEDRRHPAAGDDLVESVLVQGLARSELPHLGSRSLS